MKQDFPQVENPILRERLEPQFDDNASSSRKEKGLTNSKQIDYYSLVFKDYPSKSKTQGEGL